MHILHPLNKDNTLFPLFTINIFSQYDGLLMHLSTIITLSVGTHEWILVYKQKMIDNILKHSCNYVKSVFIHIYEVFICKNRHTLFYLFA